MSRSLAIIVLAGCASPGPGGQPDPTTSAMTFETHVLPAVHTGHGLYEPTIDVSEFGVIDVSAHSTGVGVVPAPGYVSRDVGRSNLPLAGPAVVPGSAQGSAPLFSDAIFIVAGADGTAWGVDINLRDYIVAGWCNDGAELCYYNPNAYDHTLVFTQAAECNPIPLKDRPWAAVANGTLMVNNPGGGPVQLAAMDLPPPVPSDVVPIASGIRWNLCASSGSIPGIPDLRPDGFFAVPQQQGGVYKLVVGRADDVMAVQEVEVFASSNVKAPGSQTGEYGQAAFDGAGALYVVAMNDSATGEAVGGIHVAVSLDDAATFTEATFRFDLPVSSVYMDGDRNGSGALLNWGLVDAAGADGYFGHVVIGADGAPTSPTSTAPCTTGRRRRATGRARRSGPTGAPTW